MRDADMGEEAIMSAFVPVRAARIDNALLRMSGGPFSGGCRALPAPGVPEWQAGLDYRMGASVYLGSYIYRATQPGTSGGTGPTRNEIGHHRRRRDLAIRSGVRWLIQFPSRSASNPTRLKTQARPGSSICMRVTPARRRVTCAFRCAPLMAFLAMPTWWEPRARAFAPCSNWKIFDKLLAVAGQLLFEVTDDGSSVSQTQIGGITQEGVVTMARNRNANPQVAIVCDGAYYIWQASVLSLVSDPDLPPPNSVDWLTGYFILTISDGRMYASSIDGSGVAALDFARAESNPDRLGARQGARLRVLAYGPKTTDSSALTPIMPTSRYRCAKQ